LELIYESLDYEEYRVYYEKAYAFEAEQSVNSELYHGNDMPSEFKAEQDEIYNKAVMPHKAAYINDKYSIQKEMYDRYQQMDKEGKIRLGYIYFFNRYESVGYYFRHLYRILKFIRTIEDERIFSLTNKAEKDKIRKQFKQYAQFVQSQMSIEELVLLFYNSFMFKKSQELIIHYDLLENLSIQSLIKPEHNCKPELKLKDKKDWFMDLLKKQ
jgi:hypothetical protein